MDAALWKAVTTPEGKTYFYNASTKETSWTKPDAMKTPLEVKKRRRRRRSNCVCGKKGKKFVLSPPASLVCCRGNSLNLIGRKPWLPPPENDIFTIQKQRKLRGKCQRNGRGLSMRKNGRERALGEWRRAYSKSTPHSPTNQLYHV